MAAVDSPITFTFYDSMGGMCDCLIGLPGFPYYWVDYTYDDIKFVFNLNNLSGYCNKHYIGAIEYSVEATDAIDFVLKYVTIEKFIIEI